MKLNKLQTLAEAIPRGRAADLDQMRRLFDNMENSLAAVEKWANGERDQEARPPRNGEQGLPRCSEEDVRRVRGPEDGDDPAARDGR